MNAAVVSLIALLVAIVLSITTQINVGLLAIAFAWLIGVFVAGLRPDEVIAGFPSSLFLTLAGVTLLFALAESNGTLATLAHRAVRSTGGNRLLLPLVFFLMAFALSSAGPGAIPIVALMVPMAMVIGQRAGLSPFLVALMVGYGANAGNLSPMSAVGVVVNTKMREAGLAGHEMRVWLWHLTAHLLIALLTYAFLVKYARRHETTAGAGAPDLPEAPPITRQQGLTMAVIAVWIVCVVFLKIHVGLAAFAAATLLIVLRAADERAALKLVPLGIILMVCGVTVLIALLEKTGGMDLFTTLLAKLASPVSLNGVIAFVTGLISTYSSTSGVVLPTFLPTVNDLVAKVGGGDPLAVALSINVGSSLVDIAPLSTLGALCVAAVSDHTESRRLFKQLMMWGLAMALVGALLCQLLAPLVARL
ncbi:MAG TPA: SLC13 family permease [Gemmatimonadaceae bacterium]|nr:SLC13 family permease [Gemmatimonadaceae bacterium]